MVSVRIFAPSSELAHLRFQIGLWFLSIETCSAGISLRTQDKERAERARMEAPPEPRERSPSKRPFVPTAALDAVCELKECKASSSSGGAVVNIAGAS